MLRSFVVPLATVSLTITSTVAGAAGAAPMRAAPNSMCPAPVAEGGAVTAQATRPGCVLPAIDNGVPISTESTAVGLHRISWVLPFIGFAGLAALVVVLRNGNDSGSSSLSRG